MESLNLMRAILVGCAVIAAIISAALGSWEAALVLCVGIAAHGAMWWYIHQRGTHPTIRRSSASSDDARASSA